jgi:hypothetical protein
MNTPYDEFAAALRSPTAQVPAGLLRTWNDSSPGPRLAVYRNNVGSSLARALGESFPVVKALVGDEFFTALARQFTSACPPASPVLSQYGAAFGDFIDTFPPAAELPYLADVARLEWARIQAFYAADVPALGVAVLASHLAKPEALAQAMLGLHPSVSTVVSAHPVVSIWAAHQGPEDLAQIALECSECALVFRAGDEPIVQTMPYAMAAFVRALLQHQALGDAVAVATTSQPTDPQPFDLTAALTVLIQNQLICSWGPGG